MLRGVIDKFFLDREVSTTSSPSENCKIESTMDIFDFIKPFLGFQYPEGRRIVGRQLTELGPGIFGGLSYTKIKTTIVIAEADLGAGPFDLPLRVLYMRRGAH